MHSAVGICFILCSFSCITDAFSPPSEVVLLQSQFRNNIVIFVDFKKDLRSRTNQSDDSVFNAALCARGRENFVE